MGGIISISLFITNFIIWLGLCTFFLSSSIVSKWKISIKIDYDEIIEKESVRSGKQVLANSLLPLIFSIFHFIQFNVPILLLSDTIFLSLEINSIYVGAAFTSLAVHNADTWATELGILSKKKPILIASFKTVEPGTSGGITYLGTLATLVGGLIIAIVHGLFLIFLNDHNLIINSFFILCFGILGAFIDSIFGATIQGIYYCKKCDKKTEKNPHTCGNETSIIRGYKAMSNNLVNFFSALISSLLYIIIFYN